ncbi:MAG TPA: ABC transporter substrate-binding protein, partial [Dehalococcoidia bacterium]|nr:ABC transporter substrate-binding protein [Dehalococcoidia bacterium]
MCTIAVAVIALACGDDDDATAGTATAGDAAPERAAMTFLAGFRPQANLPFVGAYVAQENGYFEEEGLDVTIEHSEGGPSNLQLVAQGRVQVTTADAAILLQRRADPGLPIVAIALIGQRGQQGWATLADAGLDSPADWAGKRVGYRNVIPPDLPAILDANGLSLADVEATDIGFQPPQLLVEGIVDVYPVFLSNEPDTIRRVLGREVRVVSAADYGVPTLGLTYVASEEYAQEHADELSR